LESEVGQVSAIRRLNDDLNQVTSAIATIRQAEDLVELAVGAAQVAEEDDPFAKSRSLQWRLLALLAWVFLVFLVSALAPRSVWQRSDVLLALMLPLTVGTAMLFGVSWGLATSLLAIGVSFFYAQIILVGLIDPQVPNIPAAWQNLMVRSVLLIVATVFVGWLGHQLKTHVTRLEASKNYFDDACGKLLDTARHLLHSFDRVKINAMKHLSLQEHLHRSERLAALGTLTSGLAHEIRNPLGAIKGSTEIIRDRMADDPRTLEFADIVLVECARMETLLTQFLSFVHGRPNLGETVEVHAVVKGVLDLVEPQFTKENIMIEYKPTPSIPMAAIGPHALHQILLNLLINASQALGSLRDDRRILLQYRLDAEEHEIVIDVCDNGPGIPPELDEKIFDPFFTTKPEGTGLGLAVAMRLIDDAKGRLFILPKERRPLSGACFSLIIPAAPESRRQIPTAA